MNGRLWAAVFPFLRLANPFSIPEAPAPAPDGLSSPRQTTGRGGLQRLSPRDPNRPLPPHVHYLEWSLKTSGRLAMAPSLLYIKCNLHHRLRSSFPSPSPLPFPLLRYPPPSDPVCFLPAALRLLEGRPFLRPRNHLINSFFLLSARPRVV